jgi:hypothetical protein
LLKDFETWSAEPPVAAFLAEAKVLLAVGERGEP